MPKLESIIKKFKLKNLVYPALFFSLSCGNNESENPVQQAQTPNKPPETTIRSPQNNSIINSKTVIAEWFGYDSDGSVVGYLFSLDNDIKNYQVGTSKSFNNLSEGLHSLEVASRDNKGQNDLTPAYVTFTIKTETIGPVDNTNSAGYAKIEIGQNVFDVYVRNLSSQPLKDVKISGEDYGTIYGFLAEDFSYNYLSELYYTGGLNKRGDIVATMVEVFMKAKTNNEIRTRNLPDLRQTRSLEYRGTASLSDLKFFYENQDIIFKSISYLEFIVKSTGERALGASLEAQKGREWIINEPSSYGKIVNGITSLVGQGWDPDAFYFDIYKHKLGVVNHYYNEENLCTLKGKVTDLNNQPIKGAIVDILYGLLIDTTDSNGNYALKSYVDINHGPIFKLRATTYDVNIKANNYQSLNQQVKLIAPTSSYYIANVKNFQLSPSTTQQTIVLQPGSSGIDSRVEKVGTSQNPCFFDCDSNFGNENYMNIVSRSENDWRYYGRGFIKFDLSQIPNNSIINSATLEVYGDPSSNYYTTSSLEVKCKEVLSSWSESTITWNNQPSLGNTLGSVTVNYNGLPISEADASWMSFGITTLVQQWISGQKQNYGISLTTDSSPVTYYCEDFIYTSDHSISSKRPKLTITYTK